MEVMEMIFVQYVMKTKLLAAFFTAFFAVFFITEAMAGQINIEVGEDWMKGGADSAPLGKVLTKVAKKAGYPIYLDEKLENAPITFNIENNLSQEKAIQRIIHPHSHAFVFGSTAEKNKFKILELRVFSKSNKANVNYITLKAGTGEASKHKSIRNLDPASNVNTAATSNTPAAARMQALNRKKMVRQNYYAKKTMFGPSVLAPRKGYNGPDYSPSISEKEKSFSKFQTAKNLEQQQMSRAAYMQAKQNYERQKSTYRNKRNHELKKYVTDIQTKN